MNYKYKKEHCNLDKQFFSLQSHKRKVHCKFGYLLHEIPDEQSCVQNRKAFIQFQSGLIFLNSLKTRLQLIRAPPPPSLSLSLSLSLRVVDQKVTICL